MRLVFNTCGNTAIHTDCGQKYANIDAVKMLLSAEDDYYYDKKQTWIRLNDKKDHHILKILLVKTVHNDTFAIIGAVIIVLDDSCSGENKFIVVINKGQLQCQILVCLP